MILTLQELGVNWHEMMLFFHLKKAGPQMLHPVKRLGH